MKPRQWFLSRIAISLEGYLGELHYSHISFSFQIGGEGVVCFSVSFSSFFLKGRTYCQKYPWTASLFLWWRKWFIYFTVTSALKWQQGIVGWRAWGPVPPWAPEVFMGIWRVSRTWLPRGSEHTHILFSLCPLKSPNFKGYWDRVGSHTSVQSKAALSSLPGRQCLLVLLQGLACFASSSQHPHLCSLTPREQPSDADDMSFVKG